MPAPIFDFRKMLEFSRWEGAPNRLPSEQDAYEICKAIVRQHRVQTLVGFLSGIQKLDGSGNQISPVRWFGGKQAATGGSTTTVEDSGRDFVAEGVKVGWSLRNDTDDDKSVITAVDTNTLTFDAQGVTLAGKNYVVLKPVSFGIEPGYEDIDSDPWDHIGYNDPDDGWIAFGGDQAAQRKRQKNLMARFCKWLWRRNINDALKKHRTETEQLGAGADAKTLGQAKADRETAAQAYANGKVETVDEDTEDETGD